jgi:pseudaminic acid biosynthesis-associated methylase
MEDNTHDNAQQREFWLGEFGDSYMRRNNSIEKVNEEYKKETGTTIEHIFQTFFDKIDGKSKILELGCNVGLNLGILQKMGFTNLYGVELNKKALDIAQKNNKNITFINSSIEDFESGETYDLVYTAGVLIHINPSVLDLIIKKIINLTDRYIFGFEYYSDNLVEIKYRNYANVCWKQNFPLLFKKLSPSLKVIKEEKFHYTNMNLVDIAYLLQKKY